MNNETAREELRKSLIAEQLPAMPHSALSVLKLDNDLSKVNINDLVRPIEADPGLAAQVLKFLNSSAFGFQSTISNIRQGVALVGIRIVKNFVLWKAVFSLIPRSKTGSFDVGLLWQDSLRRAMFSRILLLELKRGDTEMAFAGALLQDMAIPLLLKLKTADYSPVLDSLARQPASRRLSDIENDNFGWNHADAGFVLGQHWKLPEILVNLIGNHLRAEELAASFAEQPEYFVVALSSLLPSVTKADWDDRDAFIRLFEKVFSGNKRLFLNLFSRIDIEFEQYAALLQIAQPKQGLFTYIDA
ncbi:MAG: HDOD domain-containing protein [Planctomycetaceae bacterium]|jgi:HD-like signal output (HDOD) protein|nr:HDOD domain-containing protein [Planctomycetaceae bacterium]